MTVTGFETDEARLIAIRCTHREGEVGAGFGKGVDGDVTVESTWLLLRKQRRGSW